LKVKKPRMPTRRGEAQKPPEKKRKNNRRKWENQKSLHKTTGQSGTWTKKKNQTHSVWAEIKDEGKRGEKKKLGWREGRGS